MITEKTYIVNGDIEKVKLKLTDLNLYVSLHPLLNSCEKIGNTESNTNLYKINEKPFNFLPVFINYVAEVQSSANKVHYLLTEIPFTNVKMDYQLQSHKEKVKIDFTLDIKGIFPFDRILRYKMMKAQNEVMRNMHSNP